MDLKQLYQEVIVDHNRKPRNFGTLEAANRSAEGYNPLCGDRLTLAVKLTDDNVIEDIAFQGEGCAISVASASLMTDHLKGCKRETAEKTFAQFRELVTRGNGDGEGNQLGKLAALEGVRAYPSRVKCATLCWHTLHAALHGETGATTE